MCVCTYVRARRDFSSYVKRWYNILIPISFECVHAKVCVIVEMCMCVYTWAKFHTRKKTKKYTLVREF